ncbi:MAG: 23S rRNA (pseudouridine(1915)-N(3))-methyltransferase RlmH [Gemmatimonadales bacterium]
MVFRILAVGRVKNRALREACGDYATRLGRYLRIDIREVREAHGRMPDGERVRLEGEAILGMLGPDVRAVALTRLGESEDSEGLARRVEQWRQAAQDVTFVVGGASGLDRAVLERAEFRLSLSPLTLPHEIARLLLLEQLYRACTILRGEPYHKGQTPR